jgi:hypothetical protein
MPARGDGRGAHGHFLRVGRAGRVSFWAHETKKRNLTPVEAHI